MDLLSLSKSSLARLKQLVDEKQSLTSQLVAVDRSIQSILSGKTATQEKSPAPKPGLAKPISRVRRSAFQPQKRGELKQRVTAELQKSGKAGITIKELSSVLGVRTKNLHVWFGSTGKQIPNVRKLDKGRYGWKN